MNRSLDLGMITNQRLLATTRHSPELPATTRLSYPGSKKHRTEASIRVPRMFNHTHSNNMINR
jgi:hypothetical protein